MRPAPLDVSLSRDRRAVFERRPAAVENVDPAVDGQTRADDVEDRSIHEWCELVYDSVDSRVVEVIVPDDRASIGQHPEGRVGVRPDVVHAVASVDEDEIDLAVELREIERRRIPEELCDPAGFRGAAEPR